MNGVDTNYLSGFPSQVVPFEEKNTYEYGLKVARAIENEWFSNNRYGNGGGGNTGLFRTNYSEYHNRRLYARGEQSIQKYKDELAINGDLSYLNLDWKPVPILSKFVDIVVNGLADRDYDIKAYSQDPDSIKKRTDYATALMRDIAARDYLRAAKDTLGLDLYSTQNKENLPENGKCFFAANHPLGVIDGLVLTNMVAEKYGDLRAIANDAFMFAPHMRPLVAAVNVFGRSSREYLTALEDVYNSDIPITHFPAGLVSRRFNGKVQDQPFLFYQDI